MAAHYFFAEQQPGTTYSLWKSDGTEQGTKKVKSVTPQSSPVYSNPLPSALLGDKLFFIGLEGGSGLGTELWLTDGTEAGTYVVKDIHTTGSSSPNCLITFNNAVYFEAYNSANGYALWKSDGTDAGTIMIKDFNSSTASTPSIRDIKVINDRLLIVANADAYGSELWVSDGTTGGTELLKDIFPGSGGSNISELTDLGSVGYFSADNGINGKEPGRLTVLKLELSWYQTSIPE